MSTALDHQEVEATVKAVDEDAVLCADNFARSCALGVKVADEGTSAGAPANENTCAICLNQILASETAQPDCCEHIYCTCCLLHWAVYKEKPWCPQCKLPFSSMLTFRTLDGQLHDYPCRESIALLKRANWFQEHLKRKEQAIAEALLPESVRNRAPEGSVIDENDYQDYARYYEEYDDDEEVEDFYFSNAAGKARISIGNRRHGPNGFMSSGRMRARPAPQPSQAKGKSLDRRSSSGSTPKGKKSGSPAETNATPKSAPAGKKKAARLGKDLDDDFGDSEAPSAGRRARRNQRKHAADARAGSWD